MPEKVKEKTLKFTIYLQVFILLFFTFTGAGYYYYRYTINADLREVIAGKIYRSAKPSGAQLRKWIKRYGIKTVVNLRAKKLKDIESDKMVSEEMGIKFIPVDLSGKMFITSSDLMKLIEVLETAEQPILLHCRSGIDRAGTASALASFAIGKQDFDTAQRQAYVPPGPWKRKDFSKTRADYVYDYVHISDTLKLYEVDCKRLNLDKNDWKQFIRWTKEMPPIKDINFEYKPVYSYFPFFNNGKQFFPYYKLLKDSYIQFSIQILIVILLIYYTKFCLKTAWFRNKHTSVRSIKRL